MRYTVVCIDMHLQISHISQIRRGVCETLIYKRVQLEADWLVRKCINLRIFPDHQKQMNLSVQDIHGAILLVSQFTLYGNAKRGSRPSFTEAANARIAQPLYDYVKEKFSSELGRTIASGSFGASMQVTLVNDGPVTFWIERPPKYPD